MTDLALFDGLLQLSNVFTQLQQDTESTFNTGASPTDPCLWDGTCPLPLHTVVNIGDKVERKGLLPPAIVFIVQILSSVWKGLALTLVGFPFQILIWSFTVLDIAWSNFFRIVLGTWCKPCAWVLVWLFKVATFPLLVLGWSFRIFLAVVGFAVDGWMLFFGGSGCFLRWGYDCNVLKYHERSYYQMGTLPFWLRDPSSLLPGIPQGSFLDSVKLHFEMPEDLEGGEQSCPEEAKISVQMKNYA